MITLPFQLSDDELIAKIKELAYEEREATASLIGHLAELDARELYLGEGYASLFTYCIQALHLSEHAAYNRIQAARSARRFPVILEKLARGSVNLTTIKLLAPHLTPENHLEVLEAAQHKSKMEVEELVARLSPLPGVPASIRKLPGIATGGGSEDGRFTVDSLQATAQFFETAPGFLPIAETAPGQEPMGGAVAGNGGAAPSRKSVVSPLSPELYKVQFTAGAETYQKLRQAQELLRHQVPNGDPAVVMDMALTVLLEKLTRRKFGSRKRPSKPASGSKRKELAAENHDSSLQPNSSQNELRNGISEAKKVPTRQRKLPTDSRHIPAEVKREVWSRDEGQCAFVSKAGQRRSEIGHLEFHHVDPYGLGGKATLENIQLRCRPHNAYEGELCFGSRHAGFLRE